MTAVRLWAMKMSGGRVVFSVIYHPDVKGRDIPKINGDVRVRIKKAIETRLMVAPQEYGEPLRKTLKSYWKRRVGDYRIVFKIDGDEILILGICHRKAIWGVRMDAIKNGTSRKKCPVSKGA